MAEYQITGDKQDLGRKVVEPPTATGPRPNAQLVGDALPLGRSPVIPPTHTKTMGQVQQVGDSVSLNRNASEVWAQAKLPMATDPTQPK